MPSRPLPHLGMDVRIVHLGVVETGTIEDIRDDGRTLIVNGDTYTLRRLTGHFVRDGDPYYGTRLALTAVPCAS